MWWKCDMKKKSSKGVMRDTLPASHTASWTIFTMLSMNFGDCWVARQVINTKHLGPSQKLSQGILAQQVPVQRIEDRRFLTSCKILNWSDGHLWMKHSYSTFITSKGEWHPKNNKLSLSWPLQIKEHKWLQ